MSRNSQAHGFMGLMESWSWIQDLQSLYSPFFHLRKFEQNVDKISQVCDIVSESLYEIQEFVTSV